MQTERRVQKAAADFREALAAEQAHVDRAITGLPWWRRCSSIATTLTSRSSKPPLTPRWRTLRARAGRTLSREDRRQIEAANEWARQSIKRAKEQLPAAITLRHCAAPKRINRVHADVSVVLAALRVEAAEFERKRVEEEQRRKEQERERAEAERRRKEEERLRLEAERQKKEAERRRRGRAPEPGGAAARGPA